MSGELGKLPGAQGPRYLHHPSLTWLLLPPLQSVQKDEEAARQEGMAAMSETFKHKGAEIYLEGA